MARWTPRGRDASEGHAGPAMMPSDDSSRSASSVRAALRAGFAIVFGLWLLWGYQLVRSLQQIEQNVASVRDSSLRGEATLSKVRYINVLLGSILPARCVNRRRVGAPCDLSRRLAHAPA